MDKVALLTATSTVSDFSIKRGYRLIGYGGYLAIANILQSTIPDKGVAWTNNMWNAGTSLVETALGVMDGEELSNQQLAGVAFIMIGIVLLWK